MKVIPTAKEFAKTAIDGKDNQEIMAEKLIAFVKLHLQAQKEAILEVLERRGKNNNISKNIINNSYPLTKIK